MGHAVKVNTRDLNVEAFHDELDALMLDPPGQVAVLAEEVVAAARKSGKDFVVPLGRARSEQLLELLSARAAAHSPDERKMLKGRSGIV